MSPADRPTVMLVDDDPQVRQLFADILADTCETLPAESGEAALEAISDEVDLVLLDRRMLGLSGGDVLLRLREAGYEMPVAMVTAVEPDFDIIEMGFDDYVLKPVQPDELRNLVDTLVLRQAYDEVIREYFALVSKVTALQRRKTADALEANTAFDETSSRLDQIKEQAHAALDTAIETGKFDELFDELQRGQLESDGGAWLAAGEHAD